MRLLLKSLRLALILKIAFWMLVLVVLNGRSHLPPADKVEQVRAFTRQIEFDYVTWTLDAMYIKNSQAATRLVARLTPAEQRKHVDDYMLLVEKINTQRNLIQDIYADPGTTSPDELAAPLLVELSGMQKKQGMLAPLVEAIFQQQTSVILTELHLSLGGQPLPPVLYHVSDLPYALVVSPRDAIRQDANISLLPDITVDQMIKLESQVEQALDVSALVVPVGGIGTYPTMVMNTTNSPWLLDVIAHEWIHNYLTLRPLGLNYETSPEARTMNETTASIAGDEIGLLVLERFYPDLVPPPPVPSANPSESKPSEPLKFDFRKEMHTTRVKVDELLSQGKIDEAETYMEARRVIFWENGYRSIRRLNQAYFSFYGAYADTPGGAAGQDPVGPAVRQLRQESSSLADFLNRMSWMSTFEDLIKALASPQ
jgi:hypothetical protein